MHGASQEVQRGSHAGDGAGAVSSRGRRTARARRLLPLLAAALLGGCASASASDRSLSGLKAAADDAAANLEAGRYRRACEGFTASARARLQAMPRGGCIAALALSRGLLAVQGQAPIGMLFRERWERIAGDVRIEGPVARSAGLVVARYEQGRWRFETEAAAASMSDARLRNDLIAAVSSLEASAGEGLWKEILPGARQP